jgi:hypothetical protein
MKNLFANRNAQTHQDNPPPPTQPISHFFKVTKTDDDLIRTRELFINKLSGKSPVAVDQRFVYPYQQLELNKGYTLLEAVKVNSRWRETIFTYTAMRGGSSIDCHLDSITVNGKPQASFKKYNKNKDFIKYSTESLLRLQQALDEKAKLKGTAVFVLNTREDTWKERYAYLQVCRNLCFQPLPSVLLEGKYTNVDLFRRPTLKRAIKKRMNNYLKEYKHQQLPISIEDTSLRNNTLQQTISKRYVP